MLAHPHESDDAGSLTLTHEDREIPLHVGRSSPDLDGVLKALGARAWVFVPNLESNAAELEGHPARPGIQQLDAERPDRPGLFVFDLPRARARVLAREAGAESFFWGVAGADVEQHPISVLTGEEDFGDEAMWSSARDGLRSLGHALARVEEEDLTVPSGPVRTAGRGLLLFLAIGVAAHLFEYFRDLGTYGKGVRITLGLAPSVIAALGAGTFLRHHLCGLRIEERDHEPTHDESTRIWSRFAPRLAVVWCLAAFGVLALASSPMWRSTREVDAQLSGVSSNLVLALWLLPAVAYSERLEDGLKSGLSAIGYGILAIFMMKLLMGVAGIATDIVFSVFRSLLPFEAPEVVEAGLEVAAEVTFTVGFLGTMLGYTWSKQRERFTLWLSDELPGGV